MSLESQPFVADLSAMDAYLDILNGDTIESIFVDLSYEESTTLVKQLFDIAISKQNPDRSAVEKNAYLVISAFYISVYET